jgi:hypothetical protein
MVNNFKVKKLRNRIRKKIYRVYKFQILNSSYLKAKRILNRGEIFKD